MLLINIHILYTHETKLLATEGPSTTHIKLMNFQIPYLWSHCLWSIFAWIYSRKDVRPLEFEKNSYRILSAQLSKYSRVHKLTVN